MELGIRSFVFQFLYSESFSYLNSRNASTTKLVRTDEALLLAEDLFNLIQSNGVEDME